VVTALGSIACYEGHLEESQDRLERVLVAQPRSAMARLYLARVLDRRGECDKALAQLDLLKDLTGTIPEFEDLVKAHRLRRQGEELFGAGHATQALDSLVSALSLDPEDPITHNDLGVVLHDLGQPEKARESFERALELAPGLTEALENRKNL
jgi:Flp pilus assembly protein TadD